MKTIDFDATIIPVPMKPQLERTISEMRELNILVDRALQERESTITALQVELQAAVATIHMLRSEIAERNKVISQLVKA